MTTSNSKSRTSSLAVLTLLSSLQCFVSYLAESWQISNFHLCIVFRCRDSHTAVQYTRLGSGYSGLCHQSLKAANCDSPSRHGCRFCPLLPTSRTFRCPLLLCYSPLRFLDHHNDRHPTTTTNSFLSSQP